MDRDAALRFHYFKLHYVRLNCVSLKVTAGKDLFINTDGLGIYYISLEEVKPLQLFDETFTASRVYTVSELDFCT